MHALSPNLPRASALRVLLTETSPGVVTLTTDGTSAAGASAEAAAPATLPATLVPLGHADPAHDPLSSPCPAEVLSALRPT